MGITSLDIAQALADISPHDELQVQHQSNAIDWLKNGRQIYRISKPDNPPRHLVSYFVVYDPGTDEMLLAHHKLADKWPQWQIDPHIECFIEKLRARIR